MFSGTIMLIPESLKFDETAKVLSKMRNGAKEGAPFIQSHLIRVTEKAFDDFAGGGTDKAQINRMLGIR